MCLDKRWVSVEKEVEWFSGNRYYPVLRYLWQMHIPTFL